jgi:PTS system cellobiose-specific IIC component
MVVLANLLIHLLWMVGTHGASVAGAVLWPVWIGFLQKNADMVAAGGSPEFATALPLFQFLVWIGGSGATLGLVIAMFRARSRSVSSLRNIALWPAIFNINEPLIFGMPICLNPLFLVPFVLTPILLGIISWTAVKVGLVTAPFLGVPWILPAPLGAFFCTGGDWRALVLCLINIILATFIYYPFLVRYDKLMLAEERAAEQEKGPASVTR